MAVMTSATIFAAGCLALGLGLFLMAGSVRDLYQIRIVPVASMRTVTALAGALLLAAGAYVASLTVDIPL